MIQFRKWCFTSWSFSWPYQFLPIKHSSLSIDIFGLCFFLLLIESKSIRWLINETAHTIVLCSLSLAISAIARVLKWSLKNWNYGKFQWKDCSKWTQKWLGQWKSARDKFREKGANKIAYHCLLHTVPAVSWAGYIDDRCLAFSRQSELTNYCL